MYISGLCGEKNHVDIRYDSQQYREGIRPLTIDRHVSISYANAPVIFSYVESRKCQRVMKNLLSVEEAEI